MHPMNLRDQAMASEGPVPDGGNGNPQEIGHLVGAEAMPGRVRSEVLKYFDR